MYHSTQVNKLKDINEFNAILVEPFNEDWVDMAKLCGKDITVKFLLEKHWDDYLEHCNSINKHIRPAIIKNITKAKLCHTMSLGYAIVKCINCDHTDVIYASCKSRICSSCGNKYSKLRAVSIASKVTMNNHRHAVFSIAEELRPYFKDNYGVINLLFKAVADSINEYVRNQSKSKELTPGFVSILHTYGRDLKFNPHIHVVLSESFLDKLGVFKHNNYFHFEQLRRSFRTKLLKYMCEEINTRKFTNLSFYLTRKYSKGFYVHMPKNPYMKKKITSKNLQKAIGYIVRYVGKPCIANSRIIDYCEKNKTVHFIYQDHKDEEWKKVIMSVYDFFDRLTAHIPDEQFKMIRYYGFYSSNNKLRKKFSSTFKLLFSPSKIEHLKNYTYKYEHMLKYYFDQWGPKSCPLCNSMTQFVYMKYHPDRKSCSYVFCTSPYNNLLDIPTN